MPPDLIRNPDGYCVLDAEETHVRGPAAPSETGSAQTVWSTAAAAGQD